MGVAEKKRRRVWVWVVAGIAALILVLVAVVVVPIVTHQPQGSSGQVAPRDGEWPTAVKATGDDGRTRTLSVEAESGPIDTAALAPGDRLVVTGSGYDARQGIYVAICKIPPPDEKPGPCLGGIPNQEQQDVAEGTVQWAPSNWINDDWAWKLFGARSYDNAADGAFTAYLEVVDPVGDGVDCREDACGIFTRNDHTALNDRVQDLYLPVGFR